MNTYIDSPAKPKPKLSNVLLIWVVANSVGAPLAFFSGLIVAYLFGFVGVDAFVETPLLPEQIVQAVYSGISFATSTGLLLGLSQYLALRSIPKLGWWLPATAIGFILGSVISSVLSELTRFSVDKIGWFLFFVMPWTLPAISVVILQSVVLFRARYPIGIWLLVGWAPIFFSAAGYSLNGCVAIPGAIAGGIISALGVSRIFKRYELSISNAP